MSNLTTPKPTLTSKPVTESYPYNDETNSLSALLGKRTYHDSSLEHLRANAEDDSSSQDDGGMDHKDKRNRRYHIDMV
jgi:hypothetical protein